MSGGSLAERWADPSCGPPVAVAAALRGVEQRALRGEPAEALVELADLSAALGGSADASLCAIAECAVLLAAWGASARLARQLCDRALASVEEAGFRGRILLCRARLGLAGQRRADYTSALTECSAAGDIRGQALALAGLSCPRPDDGDSIVAAHHVRLARDALRLALACGDAEAIATCAGNLAAGETYLGRPSALGRWQQAAEQMPTASSLYAAEAISLNYANWALAATGYGDYATARRALHEGRGLARGDAWSRTFGALEALVTWRTGNIDDAIAAAADATRSALASPVAAAGQPPTQDDRATTRASAMAEVIAVAAAFERDRRPTVSGLQAAVARISRESDQLAAAAQAIQARIRASRHEPHPQRGLVAALDAAVRRQRRFGWEDLVMALTELDRVAARAAASAIEPLWSPGPRADAARQYVEGLLAGQSGHAQLVGAANAFAALPEPLAAAAALLAAAHTAPSSAVGNRLRSAALDVYTHVGADRSAAGVLRERSLHRGSGGPRVPTSQRNLVHPGLTGRERQVAELVRRGLTAREISQQLSLSVGTVRNHIARIRDKFGGVSKRQLTGLLSDEG